MRKLSTKKEITGIIITIILLWLIIGISYESETFKLNLNPFWILAAIIIIIIPIIAKKFAAPRYSAKIEHKIWGWQQWGFTTKSKFKKPIPMGIIFPLLISVLTLGFLKPIAFLEFHAENNFPLRIQKKQGTRRRERKMDLNESDLAFISAYGFYSLLILALISSIISTFFNTELTIIITKYAIIYGAWNLFPWGNLDGMKTFMGSPVTYSFLLIFYLISLILIAIF